MKLSVLGEEGSGRDRTKELGARRGGVYQGCISWWRELCLNTDKEGKGRVRRPGEKSGPACVSLTFPSLKQHSAKGSSLEIPSPWKTMVRGQKGLL